MKIRNFSNIQLTFSFFEQDTALFEKRFFESELGMIYSAIPWDAIIEEIGLKEKQSGRPMIFSPQGRLALMFLKNHSGFSDRKLIEHLNGNKYWQYFCGMEIGIHHIENYKIVSQIRTELAAILPIDELEKILYKYWKDYLSHNERILVDASCYESEMRYPTDAKLLWESVTWTHSLMVKVCHTVGIPRLRTKYLKWVKRYITFSKTRRKKSNAIKSVKRGLLGLLKKLLSFLDEYEAAIPLKDKKRFKTVGTVYEQQWDFFQTGIYPTDRIVSISKDYVRPIMRGKETKSVEFGAKVNKIMIDGISFIEHISFDAFNEGTRFQSSIHKAEAMSGCKVQEAGADAIYATNENRRYATNNNIKTDFKPKGHTPKDAAEQQQLKKDIQKERVSKMEGSFGKDKEHYDLRKNKGKTEPTERLWIFFGIHVANALEIGRRIAKMKQKQAA